MKDYQSASFFTRQVKRWKLISIAHHTTYNGTPRREKNRIRIQVVKYGRIGIQPRESELVMDLLVTLDWPTETAPSYKGETSITSSQHLCWFTASHWGAPAALWQTGGVHFKGILCTALVKDCRNHSEHLSGLVKSSTVFISFKEFSIWDIFVFKE